MFNRTNDTGKIQMKVEVQRREIQTHKGLDEVKVLRRNVREMQKQLHSHQVRISELVEQVRELRKELSYYKNESL